MVVGNTLFDRKWKLPSELDNPKSKSGDILKEIDNDSSENEFDNDTLPTKGKNTSDAHKH